MYRTCAYTPQHGIGGRAGVTEQHPPMQLSLGKTRRKDARKDGSRKRPMGGVPTTCAGAQLVGKRALTKPDLTHRVQCRSSADDRHLGGYGVNNGITRPQTRVRMVSSCTTSTQTATDVKLTKFSLFAMTTDVAAKVP
jgi:hypothetical protein